MIRSNTVKQLYHCAVIINSMWSKIIINLTAYDFLYCWVVISKKLRKHLLRLNTIYHLATHPDTPGQGCLGLSDHNLDAQLKPNWSSWQVGPAVKFLGIKKQLNQESLCGTSLSMENDRWQIPDSHRSNKPNEMFPEAWYLFWTMQSCTEHFRLKSWNKYGIQYIFYFMLVTLQARLSCYKVSCLLLLRDYFILIHI